MVVSARPRRLAERGCRRGVMMTGRLGGRIGRHVPCLAEGRALVQKNRHREKGDRQCECRGCVRSRRHHRHSNAFAQL
jgi:hypothetical protein